MAAAAQKILKAQQPAVSSEARPGDGQHLKLEMKVHGGGGAAAGVEGGSGGQEWVQAPPLAHLELQGRGRQEGLAGYPEEPCSCPPGCGSGG